MRGLGRILGKDWKQDARRALGGLRYHLAPAGSARARFLRRFVNGLRAAVRRRPTRLGAKPPRVSVVIPVYDRTDLLRTCVQSVLAQDYADFEVLLCCDGSPPSTLEVVQEFAKHPQVRVFSWDTQSGSPVKGRNVGIENASGKYVAFLDSDDVAAPGRLRRSVEELETGEIDVVYGAYKIITDGSSDPREHGLADGQTCYSAACDFDSLLQANAICQSTAMVRTSALRNAGGVKAMRYREDHELWLRLAHWGYRFGVLEEVLTHLRLHRGNLELQVLDTSQESLKQTQSEYDRPGPLKPRVGFVLPGIDVSGGIAVVCYHAMHLKRAGYEVTIFNMASGTASPIAWFPGGSVEAQPFAALESEELDVVFATGWQTAHPVAALDVDRKLYFIQSDETRFSPPDSPDHQQARETYQLGLEPVVIARWMQRWLGTSFGLTAHYVRNGLDHEHFGGGTPLAPRSDRVRVLLEGPIGIPFKGMANAFAAVQDVDCEVWCVSTYGEPLSGWRCDRFFHKLPMEEMKDVYASCDIFLKMSEVEGMAGPPLEMMASGAGVCVLGAVTGLDEYCVDGENCFIVPKGDVKAARAAVQRLIDDPELRQRMIAEGLKTAAGFAWEEASAAMQQVLRRPKLRQSQGAKLRAA